MEERKGSSVELGVPELPSETGDVVHQSSRVAFVPRIRLLIAERPTLAGRPRSS
jgi:hypothetical protein